VGFPAASRKITFCETFPHDLWVLIGFFDEQLLHPYNRKKGGFSTKPPNLLKLKISNTFVW
jgi:hypothetical protein